MSERAGACQNEIILNYHTGPAEFSIPLSREALAEPLERGEFFLPRLFVSIDYK